MLRRIAFTLLVLLLVAETGFGQEATLELPKDTLPELTKKDSTRNELLVSGIGNQYCG